MFPLADEMGKHDFMPDAILTFSEQSRCNGHALAHILNKLGWPGFLPFKDKKAT